MLIWTGTEYRNVNAVIREDNSRVPMWEAYCKALAQFLGNPNSSFITHDGAFYHPLAMFPHSMNVG